MRGYDAVSVADVTTALGINPPSFYAAFGNKAGLFDLVLAHWASTSSIPLGELLRADRPVAEGLAAVLYEAARRYATDAGAGCLVLEGTRCNDAEAREAARVYNRAAEDVIRAFVAARHPDEADRVTDFASTVMSGLSAKARHGHSVEQLLATARLAASAIAQALPARGVATRRRSGREEPARDGR